MGCEEVGICCVDDFWSLWWRSVSIVVPVWVEMEGRRREEEVRETEGRVLVR